MIFLLFAFVFFGWENQSPSEYNIRIYDESKLKIHGASNVNTFSFEYDPEYLQDDMCVTVKSNSDRISFENAILNLKVRGFDSGNRIMNNDLYELLKADLHPSVTIEFQSVVPKMKGAHHKSLYLNAKVRLAGQVHNELIEVNPQKLDEHFHYNGIAKLNLRNYCIEPPVKFMGLVKVHEELTINFDLKFEASENS